VGGLSLLGKPREKKMRLVEFRVKYQFSVASVRETVELKGSKGGKVASRALEKLAGEQIGRGKS